ncbi:hypothetical protein QBC34DRAFT_377234 [Podospora aff. communis PSN243]|uniref:F-box domain-containing protein n=1 Tax=Podospora aff. communis PSN243 TaxID=3040156 RepID=A0AAV9GZH9_9PEZI|nr:hypothetical protein QBC34DRAFT_377234 [Podospora aff. communis PSN243]
MGYATVTPRLSLADLPNEILIEIFSQLCHHCRPDHELSWSQPHKPSLAALCRVSRHISWLATPILYHSLDGGRVYMFETLRFLRTVFERRDLAAHVRVFAPFVRRRCIMEITKELMELLNDICHFLGIPPYDPIKRELHIAVLLKELAIRAHSLTELTLVPVQLAKSSEEEDALRSLATDPTRPLRSLRKLDMYHETESDNAFALGTIGTDLLLSAACSLEMLELNGFARVSPTLPLLPNVREVNLTLCSLGSDDLANLIESLPNLEIFRYTSKGSIDLTLNDQTDFTPAEAATQLHKRRGTLKHLSLGTSLPSCRWLAPGDVTRSYSDFPALQVLELHSLHIFPDPMLPPSRGRRLVGLIPPSIRHLVILGPCPSCEAAALASAAAAGHFPRLETVSFEAVVPRILNDHRMYKMWEMDRACWAQLKAASIDAGIILSDIPDAYALNKKMSVAVV